MQKDLILRFFPLNLQSLKRCFFRKLMLIPMRLVAGGYRRNNINIDDASLPRKQTEICAI